MKLGEYIGPIEHLVGQYALLIVKKDVVLAQFNNKDVRKSNRPWPKIWHEEPHTQHGGYWKDSDDPPYDALGFGWHKFPKEHWTIE